MLKVLGVAGVIFLVGCQSVQESNLATLKDRADKLKPLNSWMARTCRVEATLTQPALSRYRQMFPAEEESERFKTDTWHYTWSATQVSCHVQADLAPGETADPTPLEKNHLTILDVAFCMLLQTHFVNSPFAGLNLLPGDVENAGSQVHLAVSPDHALGIFLDKDKFSLETRTKTRGTLSATYALAGEEWLPVELENRRGKTQLRVTELSYDPTPSPVLGRRGLQSFWISVGEGQVFKQTHVEIRDCVKP